MKQNNLINKFPQAYSIVHKETREVWVAPSGKMTWAKPGHAKNAWAQLDGSSYIYQHNKETDEQFTERALAKRNRYAPDVKFKLYRDRWDKLRADFPKFDEQDVYELVKLETVTSQAIDLLKECAPYVPVELRNRIDEALKNA